MYRFTNTFPTQRHWLKSKGRSYELRLPPPPSTAFSEYAGHLRSLDFAGLMSAICLLQLWEWKLTNDRLKSKMEIDPASQMDKGIYQCMADNRYAIDVRAFRTSYGES